MKGVPPIKLDWDETWIPESWKQHWYLRIKDMVDNYQPDLLYSDGHIPFQDWGLKLVADHYNVSATRNGGKCRGCLHQQEARGFRRRPVRARPRTRRAR